MDESWKFISLFHKPPHTGSYHLAKHVTTQNIQESRNCVDDTFKHLGKPLSNSIGTRNYYTTKTLLAGSFCPTCLLAVMSDQPQTSHGFHTASGFTAPPEHLRMAPVHFFFYIPWVTLLPASTNLWPLTSPWQSVHLSFPLSAVTNKKLHLKSVLSQCSAMWTSTKENRKQICKPFQF